VVAVSFQEGGWAGKGFAGSGIHAPNHGQAQERRVCVLSLFTFFDVKFQRNPNSTMLTVLLIEVNEIGVENGNRVEFCDVTRVEFGPRQSEGGVLKEPYAMGLVRFDAEIGREEEISDIKIRALKFHWDDLKKTLNRVPPNWFDEFGWKYQKNVYRQALPALTEYHLVITHPEWICPPPPQTSDVDIIRGRHPDDMRELEKWKCSICFSGIEDDRELVSAHDETNGGGKRILHVFHKKCLDEWIRRPSSDHDEAKCPMCRRDMNPKHLLARWKLEHVGNTTVAARTGENPFIVACTRAHRL
jgi:hypothetical protein